MQNKKQIRKQYCDETSKDLNKYNETEYSNWLELELIDAKISIKDLQFDNRELFRDKNRYKEELEKKT